MKSNNTFGFLRAALALCVTFSAADAWGQAREPVLSLAKKEKPALLETLKEFVSIETRSRDYEGMTKLAGLIAENIKALAGQVAWAEPNSVYKREDTPEKIGKMVRATFTGTGTKKILLMAHMDTVYPRGMLAQQPFRIEGNRAYGLGISDDKQGIALIVHALA